MIGYYFSEQDNDSYAFRNRPGIDEDAPWYDLHQSVVPDMSGAPVPGVRRCSTCGALLAKGTEPLRGLVIKKRRFDISSTYDGVTVVSEAFRAAYDAGGLSGLRFVRLPDDSAFFSIQAKDIVAFDSERRGTRFMKQCPVCGQFESVVGATPVYLRKGNTIHDLGFGRTDLELGSDDGKSPLLLCGPSAGRALKTAKLKGLDLVEF